MRLVAESMTEADRARYRNVRIFLDGVEQTHVSLADEEGGYVVRYVQKAVIVADEFLKETIHGHVQIIDPTEAA